MCILLESQIDYLKENRPQPLRFIDLFAGLGGIRLGFEQALKELNIEYECTFSSELKDYAIKAYKNYFGDKEVFGDITKVDSREIGQFDFLLAGFPCQPFSTAGNGLGFDDTRGTLFFEIERILEYWKPYGFLLENVEGLINHDNGRTLSIIINHLENLGYNVSWKMLDSQYFGLAQSRKRVYIVGTLADKIDLTNFPVKTNTFSSAMEKGLPCVDSHFYTLSIQKLQTTRSSWESNKG